MGTDLQEWTNQCGRAVRVGDRYHDTSRPWPRTMRVVRICEYGPRVCDVHLEVPDATGHRHRITRIDANRLLRHPYALVADDETLREATPPADRMAWATVVRDRRDLDRTAKLVGLTLATYAGLDLRVQVDTLALSMACSTSQQVAWRVVHVLRGRGLLRHLGADLYQLTVPPGHGIHEDRAHQEREVSCA